MKTKSRNPLREQELEAVERPLLDACTLPPESYWSPEVFARESEEIWFKEWICVGRVEAIPDAGDFFTRTVITEPIIVVRDGEGEIHAHLNVCRHRGCELVGPDARFEDGDAPAEVNEHGLPYPAPTSGTVKSFRCPYHGWMYGLGGELRATPDFKEGPSFNKRDYSLIPLKVTVWNGFIFVNFDQDAGPLEDRVSEMSKWGFERYDAGTMVQVATWDRPIDCNWKVYIENSLEAYHVPFVHLGLRDLTPLKGWKQFTDLTEQQWMLVVGQFPGMSYSDAGDTMFTPRPGLADAHPEYDGLPILVLFPGMLLILTCDTMVWRMCVPVGPEESVMWQGLCIPADGAEALRAGDPATEKKVRDLCEMMLSINTEDKTISEKMQRGVRSRTARQGRFTKHEALVQQFNKLVIDRAYDDARLGNGANGNGSAA